MLVKYLRVSTKDQTIENQRNAINKKFDEKEYTEFCDEGLTGRNTQRDGFVEMMNFIRKGDILVVYSLSRLARSTKDLLNIVETLEGKGVKLVSITENIDTGTPTGRLMITMLAAINQFEVEVMKERTMEGIARAKIEGKFRGGKRKEVTKEARELTFKWINKEVREKDALLQLKELGYSRGTAFKMKKECRNEASEKYIKEHGAAAPLFAPK